MKPRGAVAWLVALAGCSFHPNAASDDVQPGSDAPRPGDGPIAFEGIQIDGPPGPQACLTSDDYSATHGGHRYRVTDPGLEYDEAFDLCNADGAHMVVIDNADEQGFVADTLNAVGGDSWIGMNDLYVEGTMEWVDGATSAFRAFDVNEPNDAGGHEDCAVMQDNLNNHNNTWNDTPCSDHKRAICECEAAYVAPPTPQCRAATSGFVEVDGRRYFPMPLMTHTQAAKVCHDMGAYLFAPADIHENGLLYTGTGQGGIGLVNDAWIGLSPNNDDTAFVWDSGSPSLFRNFQGGAPTPQAGKCLELHASNAQWTDVSCGDNEAFACECDPEHPAE